MEHPEDGQMNVMTLPPDTGFEGRALSDHNTFCYAGDILLARLTVTGLKNMIILHWFEEYD